MLFFFSFSLFLFFSFSFCLIFARCVPGDNDNIAVLCLLIFVNLFPLVALITQSESFVTEGHHGVLPFDAELAGFELATQ